MDGIYGYYTSRCWKASILNRGTCRSTPPNSTWQPVSCQSPSGHSPESRARPNTVQLGWPRECLDGLAGPSDGLGPVAVAGAFDAVVAHLAFDDAGCGAQASGRQQFPADLGDGRGQRDGEDLGGGAQPGPPQRAGRA